MSPDIELVNDGVALGWQVLLLGGVDGVRCLGDGFAAVQRLRLLAAVPVDGHRLEAELPGCEVRLLDVLDRALLRHVDGLRNSTREEGLDRVHHLDVAHVVDGAFPAERFQGAIEYRKVFFPEIRRPLDVAVLVHVVPDPLESFAFVAEPLECRADGLVDDSDDSAAAELLVLDQ